MPSLLSTLLVITVVLVLLPGEAAAFGAGDIPDFSYLNGKAFRHGDIENILLELTKSTGGHGGGGGLLGFATSVLSAASGGSKFSKDDVKRVYFIFKGNWLRDYSQAMDIAGLSKLSGDTLILIVWILGFLTFGFATEEFEVTADRLGVYLPVEHIDNPKGYAEVEGDARQFHPKLRPPVDPRELEIDERTGMKNYMATEGQGWDTSTEFIRRSLQACIYHGREAQGQEGAHLFEAFRTLGQGLHTLEDFTAHSNWCEIALRKLGHKDVFCHVGDNVLIDTPSGDRAPPIVTGTFGGADFLHSLMGEATDHISQSSVTDLSEKMKNANQGESMEALKGILSKFRGSGGDNDAGAQANQAEDFKKTSEAYNFDPDNLMPPDVQKQLFEVLKWRDGVYRDIEKKIAMIPGLTDLLDTLSNALNAYVYTVLAPYVTPILSQVTTVLGEGSKEVIDSKDQYEVFNDADASDPTHSVLSKDHFQIILNECAGKVAQVVITNAVNLIVPAWSNDENPDRIIDQILEAFHHPYYSTGRSQIQNSMFETMEKWIGGMGHTEAQKVIQQLSKESVRAGKNKREGSEDENSTQSQGGGGYAGGTSQQSGNYGSSEAQGNQGRQRQSERSGRGESDNSYGRQQEQESAYGRSSQSGGYGDNNNESSNESRQPERRKQDFGYGGRIDNSQGRDESSNNEESQYGGRSEGHGGGRDSGRNQSRNEESGYGGSGNRGGQNEQYSRESRQSEHGRSSGYGQQNEESERSSGYGQDRERHSSRRDEGSHGGGGRREEQSSSSGYAPSYNQPESGGYDSGRSQRHGGGHQEQSNSSYAPSYSQPQQSEGYGGGRDEAYRGNRNDSESHSSRQESGGHRGSGERERPHHGGHHGHHESEEDNQGETYGAERLNLRDDEGESRSERRRDYSNDY